MNLEGIVKLQALFTVNDLWIAIWILVSLVAIEGGIILGLATRVGSLRNLFNLTMIVNTNHPSHDTAYKKNPTTN